jgi:hypothetical protein
MRRLSTAIVTVSIAAALAGCGSSSSGGKAAANPTANPAAAKAAITKVYESFFSAPIPTAKTMLQDGANLSKAFAIANKLKGTATESAKVKTVTLTGPTTADVVFELDTNGNPIIPKSDGKAVYVGGKWLVAKQTFCTLVGLGHTNGPVPNC